MLLGACAKKARSQTNNKQHQPMAMNANHAMNKLMLAQARLLNMKFSGQFDLLGTGRMWKLEQELIFVDLSFDNCISLLRESGKLEHGCLEEIVSAVEGLPREVLVLLQLLDEADQISREIPEGVQWRAMQVIVELEHVTDMLDETCKTIRALKQRQLRANSLDSKVWWTQD